MDGSSELNVNKEGRVSFFNNHAGGSGGKYCHPWPHHQRFLPLDGCALSPCFIRVDLRRQDFSYNFSLSGAILLYRQSVFKSRGTASFVSNEAELGGAMRGKSSNRINLSICPNICHSPRPNLVTYGIEQPMLIYSHTQRYTVAQTKHRKSSQIGMLCCSCLSIIYFTIVSQGLIFPVVQEFTFDGNAASFVGHKVLNIL